MWCCLSALDIAGARIRNDAVLLSYLPALLLPVERCCVSGLVAYFCLIIIIITAVLLALRRLSDVRRGKSRSSTLFV
jgi:uncharacterized membrane protein YhaH (DUF805 family)